MEYNRTVTLKDGRTCIVRNGMEKDAENVLAVFTLTQGETDFLTTYPDELSFTAEQEREFLKKKTENSRDAELVAEVDGKIVGTAGIGMIRDADKTRHRAHFGIAIEKAAWGIGIGKALTEACIDCARTAGYIQLEREVVADNERALALDRRAGFVEYGRNPRGFRPRKGGWQENVLMRLELDAQAND